MENLAYLYILAEEAALEASDQRKIQKQDETQDVPHRSPPTVTRSVDSVKATLDRDRAAQSYPTFYL